MGLMKKFETLGVAPAERLAYWNDLCDRIYVGTYVNSPEPDFGAQVWCWKVGALDMIRPRCDQSQVGRWADSRGSEERIVLHLQHRGTSRLAQFACEADLGPGDFSLCSANRSYVFDLSPAHELLVVEFPRSLIEGRLADLDDRLARCISGASPGGRIFRDFLLSLWREGDQSDADPDWQGGVTEVFADLVALAARGADVARDVAPGSALREKMVGLVDARLCDPGLRTSTLAGELGVSARTVQNLFAAMGATPSSYVLDRRLRRAAERLAADRGTSITDIAYDLGFNDSAYFARCFRQRFGMTPSDWRGDRNDRFVSSRSGPVAHPSG